MPPGPQDQQFMNQFGGPEHMHQFFAGSPGGPFVMMALFFIVIAAGVLLIAGMRRRHHGPHGHHFNEVSSDGPLSALRVLDERLARGEVDPEDYGVRRDLLRAQAQPSPA